MTVTTREALKQAREKISTINGIALYVRAEKMIETSMDALRLIDAVDSALAAADAAQPQHVSLIDEGSMLPAPAQPTSGEVTS